MEDWIKNNLEELEMTPKAGNWEAISAGLDGEKKNKKRFLFILLFSLATVGMLIAGWFMYDVPAKENTATNTTQQEETTENSEIVASTENDTSNYSNPNRTSSNEVPKITNEEYQNSAETTSQLVENTSDNYETNSDESSIEEGVIDQLPNTTEGITRTEHTILPFIEIKESDDTKVRSKIEINLEKWTHSLKSKKIDLTTDTYPFSYPSVDLDAIVLALDSMENSSIAKNPKPWPSLLIPGRVYAEYSRGSNLNNANSYLDITSNTVNNIAVGVGYTLSPRFEVDFGAVYYNGSVSSNVGNKIVVFQKDFGGIGTSRPPDAVNSTMDTLITYNSTVYQELKDEELYAKGQKSTLTQSVSGYKIPISVNFKLMEYNSFSIRTQLGMTFNLVNDYSYLSYLDEFQLTVNNSNESNGTALGSYSLRGGLVTEYRPRKLGVYAAASMSLNRTAKLPKSIFTESYQPSIGIGVSYYLNGK
jgi:hypothetical protein